jgi:S-adenosylmethionine:tRNA ribosyltransferase-isomerase
MRVDTFDYELRQDSIAQRPLSERDSARLLVLPAQGDPSHHIIRDLPALLPPGALLVLNDTRVIPARLLGHKLDSGGKVEVLLLRRLETTGESQRWEAMGRASKGLPPGCIVVCGPLRVRVLARAEESRGSAADVERGLLEVEVRSEGAPLEEALSRAGHMPLPPYIRRPDEAGDHERYQTVFARVDGAVAAPTAGLHFTESLLERLRAAGSRIATVTLHVGLGTFQPVTAEDLDEHRMHEESFRVSCEAAEAIADARRRAAPVVAVGTTVMRALESAADPDRPGLVRAMEGKTRLLIQPGYRFRIVDRLLTNFHVPRSTLLALVCAFGGTGPVLDAYKLAQRERYRFFSYGDAMSLERGS